MLKLDKNNKIYGGFQMGHTIFNFVKHINFNLYLRTFQEIDKPQSNVEIVTEPFSLFNLI